MRDTPPYEEHGLADATNRNARLTLVYVYLADGDECDERADEWRRWV